MSRYFTTRLFLVVLSSFLTILAASAQVVSDFESSNDDGWTVKDVNNLNPLTPTYNATLGNPNGFISSTIASGQPFYWYAPAKFLGDKAYTSFGETLQFDLQTNAALPLISSANGDVILRTVSYSLIVQLSELLPAVGYPAATPGWTSYSVKLDDTTPWKINGTTGAVATRDQVLAALGNLTQVMIHIQYKVAGGITGGLDNVVMGTHPPAANPPVITSFTPLKTTPGSPITINGSGFSATGSDNIVYFGGIAGNVTAASVTQLTVTVPAGADYGRVVVVNTQTNLSGTSLQSFNPLFTDNAGARILRSSFDFHVDLNRTAGYLTHGDFNGDGKPEVVVSKDGFISIYPNVGTPGTIDGTTFDTRIDLTPSAAYQYVQIEIVDLDGDGKLDIAVAIRDSPDQGRVVLVRNISTGGPLTAASFAPSEETTLPPYTLSGLKVGDIDGDGRPDLVSWGSSCGANPVYISLNVSVPGQFLFEGQVSIPGINSCGATFAIADLDLDGKQDIIQSNGGETAISRNNSTPGVVNFDASFNLGGGGNYATVGDLDNDSKPDIIWASANLKVRKNISTPGSLSLASFAGEVVFTPANGQVVLADINGDGKPDVIAGHNGDFAVHENTTTDGQIDISSFALGVPFEANATATNLDVADIDADGKPDVIVNNGAFANIYVLRNIIKLPPTVTNISPLSGQPGSSLTITGTNFSTDATANNVFFGTAKATVNNASATTLDVTIPVGAAYDQVSVAVNGFTVFGSQYFVPTFSAGSEFNTSSFATPVDINTGSTHDGIVAADFDLDGKIDLLSEHTNSFAIHHNEGTTGVIDATTFAPFTTFGNEGVHLQKADLDGDGRLDIFTYSYAYRNISASNLPNPITFDAFVAKDQSNQGVTRAGEARDLNADGKIDLLVTPAGGAAFSIQENQTRVGAFTPSSSPYGSFATHISPPKVDVGGAIAVADFDGDGFIDAASTNTASDNFSVILNEGQTTVITSLQFSVSQQFTTGDGPTGIVAADFDLDGKPDLAVSNGGTANTISVFRNTSIPGTLSFTRQDFPANFSPQAIVAADMDGDGKPDLVVINILSTSTSFSVFRNKSTSGVLDANSFSPRADIPVAAIPLGLAVADLDGDLRPDVIIPRAGTIISIYKNQQTVGPIISFTQQPVNARGCEGATATFTALATGAANLSWQWQKLNTTNSQFEDLSADATYSGVTTSTLTVTGIDASFDNNSYRCIVSGDNASDKTSDVAMISFAPAPAPPATGGDSACAASSVDLTASGSTDGNYRWFLTSNATQYINGEFNSTFTTPVILSTTDFFVAIVSADGCLSPKVAATGTITPLAKPTISAPNTEVCGSNSVTISGPAGFSTYTWSNGGSTQNIDVNFVGNYSLVVTDANGCQSLTSDPVTITSGGLVKPVIVAPKTQLCSATDQLVLSGPAGFNFYKWSTNETTSTITVTTPGDYTLIVSNTVGCESPSSDVLTVSAGASKPIISIGSDVLVSTPAATYQWYFGGVLIPDATEQFLPFNPFQYGEYTVTVTDVGGCTAESEVFVNLVTAIEPGNSDGWVYPNPFSQSLHLGKTIQAAELYDMAGRRVMNLSTGDNNTSGISSGLYLMKFNSNGLPAVVKLSKQ